MTFTTPSDRAPQVLRKILLMAPLEGKQAIRRVWWAALAVYALWFVATLQTEVASLITTIKAYPEGLPPNLLILIIGSLAHILSPAVWIAIGRLVLECVDRILTAYPGAMPAATAADAGPSADRLDVAGSAGAA